MSKKKEILLIILTWICMFFAVLVLRLLLLLINHNGILTWLGPALLAGAALKVTQSIREKRKLQEAAEYEAKREKYHDMDRMSR